MTPPADGTFSGIQDTGAWTNLQVLFLTQGILSIWNALSPILSTLQPRLKPTQAKSYCQLRPVGTCSEIKLYGGGGGQFLQMSLSPAIHQRKNYIEPVPATWHYSRWLRLGRQFFQNDILAAEKSPLVHCTVSRTIIYNNQSYVLSKARIYKFGIVVDSQLLNKYSGSHIYEEKREKKKTTWVIRAINAEF